MTKSYSVNHSHYSPAEVSDFYYPPEKEEFVSDLSDNLELSRLEKWHFFARHANEERVKENKQYLENKTKSWNIAEKILFVVSKIISIVFPLFICYCPVWVPWGIVLPGMIVLGITHYKVKQRAELYEIYKQHAPLIKKFLEKDLSLKQFSPLGEWDLPETDPRLISDRLMKEGIGKKHPPSTKDLIDPIERLNLEYSFLFTQHVAEKLTGIEDVEDKWQHVYKKEYKAKQALHKGDLANYLKLHAEAREFKLPYRENPLSEYDHHFISMRSQLQHLMDRYFMFCHFLNQAEEFLKNADKLYSQIGLDYSALEGSEKIFDHWGRTYKRAWKTKIQLEPLISLLIEIPPEKLLEKNLSKKEKAEEHSLIEDWEFRCYKALLYVKENQLDLTLTYLIDDVHHLKKDLQQWVGKHPHERIKLFQKKMRRLDLRILNQKSLKMLALWMKKDGDRKNISFIQLPEETRDFWKKRDFPKEVERWLASPEGKKIRHYSPSRLLKSNKIAEMDKKTIALLQNWEKDHPNLSANQSCQEIIEEMYLAEPMLLYFDKDFSIQFETFAEILKNSLKLRTAFTQSSNTLKELAEAEKELRKSDSNETEEEASIVSLIEYKELCKNLDTFETQTLSKLGNLYENGKIIFRVKTMIIKMFSPSPVLPFENNFPSHPLLRARKFQEYRLNQLLQEHNTKMIYIGRTVLTGIPAMSYLIIAVQAIFSYFTIPSMFFWGFSSINVLLISSAYYLNHLLKKEDRKKQAVKMQHLLQDHPGVGTFPGTCSHLKYLKRLEGQLGLDGVERTVAVGIMEGNQALPIPKDRESAKKRMRSYAKEGSKKAEKYLENRLVILKSKFLEYRSLEREIKKGVKLVKQINQWKEELAVYQERLPRLCREIFILNSQLEYQKNIGNQEKVSTLTSRLKQLEEKKGKQEENLKDLKEIYQELNLRTEKYKNLNSPVKKGIKIALSIEEIETSLNRTPLSSPNIVKTQKSKQEIQQKKWESEIDAIKDQIWIKKVQQRDYNKLLTETQQLQKNIISLSEKENQLKEKASFIAHLLENEELLEGNTLLVGKEQCTPEIREELDQQFNKIRNIFNRKKEEESEEGESIEPSLDELSRWIEEMNEMIKNIKAEKNYSIPIFQDYYLYYQYQIELTNSKRLYKETRLINIFNAEHSCNQIIEKIRSYQNEIDSLTSKLPDSSNSSSQYSVNSSLEEDEESSENSFSEDLMQIL